MCTGTEIDQRTNTDKLKELAKMKQVPVKYKEGVKMAEKIGAVKYIECSADTQEGLKEVKSRVLCHVSQPRGDPSATPRAPVQHAQLLRHSAPCTSTCLGLELFHDHGLKYTLQYCGLGMRVHWRTRSGRGVRVSGAGLSPRV